MSDIQRYRVYDDDEVLPFENGEYVTYADHVAAVAAAQREGANQGYLNGVATNADNSFKAGVKAAREAVAAVACGPQGSSNRFWRDTALAAIDALRTPDE